jgi:GNAT superfamily N-acetyltransferase
MDHIIVPYRERPDIDEERWEQIVRPVWPPFMLHDAVANENWHHLSEPAFVDFQFYVLDPDTDEVLCQGNTIPFAWDGDPHGLPEGIDEVLPLAVRQQADHTPPTTLCALQAVVTKGNQGRGLAKVVLEEMRRLARDAGFGDLVAPVRPSWKHRFPLISMEAYAGWRNEDGLPYDPWYRQHLRASGSFLQVCPRSMNITGTVADWTGWTDMTFPGSGDYLVEGALVPVHIDIEADLGTYIEPNQWIRHSLQRRRGGEA